MKSNIQYILYNLAPETLTDKDISTVEAQEELTKLYANELEQPLEPSLAAQKLQDKYLDTVAMRIHNALNPYEKVASTVDAPILDETNILYKTEGIDDVALFKVLELHHNVSGQNNTPIPTDWDDTLKLSKVPYKQFTNTINEWDGKHIIKEVRAQRGTNQSNQIEWVLSDADAAEDENNSLQDINPNHKQTQLYFKQKKVLETSKYLLENAWKSYRKRQTLRDSSLGNERIDNNKKMMDEFNNIKRYQSYIERIEKIDYDIHMKSVLSNRQKQYDYYLDKFVSYQQQMIKENKELKREREDVLNKYEFLRNKPVIKPYVPSWKKSA